MKLGIMVINSDTIKVVSSFPNGGVGPKMFNSNVVESLVIDNHLDLFPIVWKEHWVSLNEEPHAMFKHTVGKNHDIGRIFLLFIFPEFTEIRNRLKYG